MSTNYYEEDLIINTLADKGWPITKKVAKRIFRLAKKNKVVIQPYESPIEWIERVMEGQTPTFINFTNSSIRIENHVYGDMILIPCGRVVSVDTIEVDEAPMVVLNKTTAPTGLPEPVKGLFAIVTHRVAIACRLPWVVTPRTGAGTRRDLSKIRNEVTGTSSKNLRILSYPGFFRYE